MDRQGCRSAGMPPSTAPQLQARLATSSTQAPAGEQRSSPIPNRYRSCLEAEASTVRRGRPGFSQSVCTARVALTALAVTVGRTDRRAEEVLMGVLVLLE